jgi:acetyl-CoA acetyltransferase family protein
MSAAREIQVGACDFVVAGGVESMTRAPYVVLKPETAFERGNHTAWDTTLGWRMTNPRMEEMYPTMSLGQTAEKVAEQYGLSREDQDRLALCSHQRAVAAQDKGRFDQEIVSVGVPSRSGSERVERDEGPRRDTSLEALARLRAAFVKDGTVTAGNSSSLNDGAAALLLASRDAVRRLELDPLARFVDGATAGVDPSVMGMGPVPATRKLLARHGMEARQLDVVEMNEAFASQVLACMRELGLSQDQVNPNGGAIALGHPLGASGARLATTLLYQLQRTEARYGLATMCVGVGQGISVLFERVAG